MNNPSSLCLNSTEIKNCTKKFEIDSLKLEILSHSVLCSLVENCRTYVNTSWNSIELNYIITWVEQFEIQIFFVE